MLEWALRSFRNGYAVRPEFAWTGFKYMFSWGEREQLKPLPEMIDKNHPLYYGPTDYNFKVGGPLTIADLREFLLEFKQEQDAAGETYATMALKETTNAKFVSDQLGHKSVKTTLDIYYNPNHEDKKIDVMKITGIDNFLFKAKENLEAEVEETCDESDEE